MVTIKDNYFGARLDEIRALKSELCENYNIMNQAFLDYEHSAGVDLTKELKRMSDICDDLKIYIKAMLGGDK